MVNLGTIEQVELREVWPHEAQDFTPWLADNLDKLGEALGLDLELQSAEAAVGSFSLDVLAHDLGSNRPVIIENQLEVTNHDHLENCSPMPPDTTHTPSSGLRENSGMNTGRRWIGSISAQMKKRSSLAW